MNYKVYTDGASKGNPGPAGAGGVIYDAEGSVIAEVTHYLGVTTNNVAEYTALLLTLEQAILLGIKHVDVFMDSKLVVEQMNGRWKIKNPVLKEINNKLKILLPKFQSISFTHIYRDLNTYADNLANKAIN